MVRWQRNASDHEDVDHVRDATTGPVSTLLLGFPLALFLGALISDLAYYQSYQVQWANFSSWLIAGGLLVGALVVVMAVVAFFRRGAERGRPGLFLGLVALMWIVGLVNALVHARDGWAMMPTGLILSLIVVILAVAAAWAALRRPTMLEAR
jgi:uncharacterized membrane protein